MNIQIKPIHIFLLLFAALLCALLIFFYRSSQIKKSNIVDEQNTISPFIKNSVNNNSTTRLTPKINGIDLKSPTVQESVKEIQKLQSFLPYSSSFVYENQNIDIVIPSNLIIEHPWVLQVNIFGVDFSVSKTSTDNIKEQEKFIFAVSEVKKWISSKGIDDTKITYQWGDNIDDIKKAEEWLR